MERQVWGLVDAEKREASLVELLTIGSGFWQGAVSSSRGHTGVLIANRVGLEISEGEFRFGAQDAASVTQSCLQWKRDREASDTDTRRGRGCPVASLSKGSLYFFNPFSSVQFSRSVCPPTINQKKVSRL